MTETNGTATAAWKAAKTRAAIVRDVLADLGSGAGKPRVYEVKLAAHVHVPASANEYLSQAATLKLRELLDLAEALLRVDLEKAWDKARQEALDVLREHAEEEGAEAEL